MKKTLIISSYRKSLLPQLIDSAWNAGWVISMVPDNLSKNHMTDIHAYFDGTVVEATAEGIRAVKGCDPLHSQTESPSQWIQRHTLPTGSPPYPWLENECALILFTSGSTDVPKGVCHSRGNILRSAQLFVEHFELTEHDLLLCLAPAHTMSGFRSLILPSIQTRHVHKQQSFLSLVHQISEIQATVVLCGPIFIKQLAEWSDRLKSHMKGVRGLLCTGAKLQSEDRNRVEQTLGIPVLDYYGLTETAGLVLGDTFSQRSHGCLPAPCRNVELILKPTNHGDGIFELAISSPNLFLGYLGSPLYRRSIFNTGDLIKKLDKHCLQLIGRHSGATKAPSTEWIYPQRLENWLHKHLKQVSDAVARSVPIPGGEGLEVWINAIEDLDTVRIEKQIIKQLGKDYQPVRWHFSHIERTPLGKLSSSFRNST